MQGSEGFRGLGFLFGCGGGHVFNAMQFLQFRLQPKAADQIQSENSDEQSKSKFLEDASGIKPFGQEMNDSNRAADVIENEKAREKNLRDGPRIIIIFEEVLHFGRKNSR